MTNRHEVRYVINPLLQAPAWVGDDWGLRIYPCKSWLNSVWLGTVWNFMCVPQRFFYAVVMPLMALRPVEFCIGLAAFFLNTVGHVLAGLAGYLIMLPYPLKVMADALVLPPGKAKAALEAGMFEDGYPVAVLKP